MAELLHLDPATFEQAFDKTPFGFSHELHKLELFSFESLRGLAQRIARKDPDWFVARSAVRPEQRFYSVDQRYLKPHEALEQLETGTHRILLKRVETHDSAFRDLLDQLFDQVIALRGGLRGARIVRRESAIFISSGEAITPFHYDPEINFFAQIEGEKEYHVYAPSAVQEPELENFFVHGQVDIAQVPLAGRDPAHEQVFKLKAGLGHHQPQNSPHWVKTGASRSISYSMVWETDESRATGRARACNYYLRRLGLQPSPPGKASGRDAAKAGAMQVLTPMRKAAVSLKRSLFRSRNA